MILGREKVHLPGKRFIWPGKGAIAPRPPMVWSQAGQDHTLTIAKCSAFATKSRSSCQELVMLSKTCRPELQHRAAQPTGQPSPSKHLQIAIHYASQQHDRDAVMHLLIDDIRCCTPQPQGGAGGTSSINETLSLVECIPQPQG